MNRRLLWVGCVMVALCARFAAADSVTFTTSVNDYTDFYYEALTVPQFDTMEGTRALTSVRIVADAWLSSLLSGSIVNKSPGQTAFYWARVGDASVALTGPGLSTAVSALAGTLYEYGTIGSPVSIQPNTTHTIHPPQDGDLAASRDVTLTSDLSAFVGTGSVTYLLNAAANAEDSLTGSSNVVKNLAFETVGGGSVSVTYDYAIVPVPASAVAGMVLLGLVVMRRVRRGRE